MSRIRTIKPEFFLHEGLASLSPLHRLLFEGLWVLADRNGRLKDRPGRIKAAVLPYDSCDIDAMLDDLASHAERFIVRYRIEGDRFIEITKFLVHQRPHYKEPEGFIPAAPEGVPARRSKSSKFNHEPKSPQHHPKDEPIITEEGRYDLVGKEGKGMDKGNGTMQQPSMMLEGVLEQWKHIPGVVQPTEITMPIRQRIHSRIREHPNQSWWEALFQRIAASEFLCGRKTDFTATLDWILAPKNLAKIMAGNYDNRGSGLPLNGLQPESPTARALQRIREIEEAHHG
jgi:hypothetical protein